MLTILEVLKLPSRRQRGIAAVEFAVILPLLVILLTFPIFFGRLFMHYSVIQKAAHDAAMYYARIPKVEMSSQTRSLAAVAVAQSNIDAELAELNPGGGRAPVVQFRCDDGPCGDSAPNQITVHIRLTMFDDYFNDFTWEAVGANGIQLNAQVTMSYLGD